MVAGEESGKNYSRAPVKVGGHVPSLEQQNQRQT